MTQSFMSLPAQSVLRKMFEYDEHTGLLRWKEQPEDHDDWRTWQGRLRHYGKTAGHTRNGYYCVGIKGRSYFAHRVIWKWVTGDEPKEQIDHIDGNKKNNRWSNLREASNQMNVWNARLTATGMDNMTNSYAPNIRDVYDDQYRMKMQGN